MRILLEGSRKFMRRPPNQFCQLVASKSESLLRTRAEEHRMTSKILIVYTKGT